MGGAVQPGGREFLCGARVTVAGHEVLACYRAVQDAACAAAAGVAAEPAARTAIRPSKSALRNRLMVLSKGWPDAKRVGSRGG